MIAMQMLWDFYLVGMVVSAICNMRNVVATKVSTAIVACVMWPLGIAFTFFE